MNLKDIQSEIGKRWGSSEYTSEYNARPDAQRDAHHAALHVTKALGKVAGALDDLDHENSANIEAPIADIVICAARIASKWPGQRIDLGDAVRRRIAEKFPPVATDTASHDDPEVFPGGFVADMVGVGTPWEAAAVLVRYGPEFEKRTPRLREMALRAIATQIDPSGNIGGAVERIREWLASALWGNNIASINPDVRTTERRRVAGYSPQTTSFTIGQRHCAPVIEVASDLMGNVTGSGDPIPEEKRVEMELWLWWRTQDVGGWDGSPVWASKQYDNAIREMARASVIASDADARRRQCSVVADDPPWLR